MPSLKVFDRAMCCSTGVCGPEVDAELVRFAADVEWLKSRGVQVDRYNLGQEPNAFAREPLVRQTLQSVGVKALPLVLVDGVIASRGLYPEREQLAALAGLRSSGPPTPETADPVLPSPQERGTDTSSCCTPALVELGGGAKGCC